MKRIKTLTNLVLIAGFAFVIQGCATIFGGRMHTLVFNEHEISEAQVFVNDTLVGEASGKLRLPKGTIQHGSILEIRSEGYVTQEHLILLLPHAGYIVADFVVGAVPLIVDYGTGDILRPKPRKFDVDLEKEN